MYIFNRRIFVKDHHDFSAAIVLAIISMLVVTGLIFPLMGDEYALIKVISAAGSFASVSVVTAYIAALLFSIVSGSMSFALFGTSTVILHRSEVVTDTILETGDPDLDEDEQF